MDDMLAAVKPINKKSCTRKKNKLKVVYISSPMKVKTSASKFRALVQELTGRHSDISRYHSGYFHHAAATPTTTTTATAADTLQDANRCAAEAEEGMLSMSRELEYSFLDDVFRSEVMINDQFEGMLSNSCLYDSCL